MNKKILLIISFLTLIWIIGIVNDFDELSTKRPNPEYQKYIANYKAETERKYNDIIAQLEEDYRIQFNTQKAIRVDDCIGSNFEGAEVKLAGIQVYDSIFRQKSKKPHYVYHCNSAKLDPDHPMFGLPDIEIAVGPVNMYEPEKTALESLIKLGIDSKPKPYRTFKKRLIVDSLGIQNKFIEMQLWLTSFKVSITVMADRDKPQVDPTEASLNEKKYPGYWYKDSRRYISINDLEHKEEYKNHQYSDITFVMEVNPNASPWYIKTENTQTEMPDIAVGAVFCEQLIKYPKDENKIHLQTYKGMAAPLYHKPFENETPLSDDLDESIQNLITDLENVKNENIWNKKYYIKLYSANIGSRKQGFLGTKKFDEQVEYTFLMPLFVVGSWDIQIPSEILPEMEAPKAYYKSFGLKNLVPKWGLGFGKWVSSFLILILGMLVALYLFPVLLKKLFK
ncbi:hypothetical protein ACFLS4_01210 [Bacteroidota bacterium]